jgi:hypothetical protein
MVYFRVPDSLSGPHGATAGSKLGDGGREGGVMIDLNHMVERFLDEAVRQCVDESPDDDAVIRALNNRIESAEIRRNAVLEWLRSYSVLRRLNNDEARTIGDGILEFADARGAVVRPLSEAGIIEKFTDLHEKYRLLVSRPIGS